MTRKPSLSADGTQITLLHRTEPVIGRGIWNRGDLPLLWLFHLHYFDDLAAAEVEGRRPLLERWVDRWIMENPPGSLPGWHPYPTSRRVVNWIIWSLRGGVMRPSWLASLAQQVDWLARNIEWDLRGNHLIADAKALVFAGLFFSGKEAGRWLALGERILNEALVTQILADGGHYELSPMYHAIVLEDLLHLFHVYECYSMQAPDWLRQPIEPMLRWLAAMSHPDGEVAFFNDAAGGQASPLSALAHAAAILGFENPAVGGDADLAASGYVRIEHLGAVFFIDAAPAACREQPGHAHADTLSFECSLYGKRYIVNCGVSQYGESDMRAYQRSTPAHSTLVVDGIDSSEVWGAFRLGRRARIVERQVNLKEKKVLAVHDGYVHRPGLGVHRRSWRMVEDGCEVTDELEGSGIHEIAIYFHLHPEIRVEPLRRGEGFLLIHSSGEGAMTLEASGPLLLMCEDDRYFPEFGLEQACRRIAARGCAPLPVRVKTRLRWRND